ncbi:MAG: tryptophan synthase subunit alpha [Gemmatimonadota bacterium]
MSQGTRRGDRSDLGSPPVSGVERLALAFQRCAEEGRAALIPFCVAGDPDLATTVELARAAAEAGADVLELGVPFSDSLADGPVIQDAYARALAAGTNVRGVLACASEIVAATGLPLVLMTALNPVLSYDVVAFCRDAAAARAAGVLIPDLPVEDARHLRATCARFGLATVFLAAPDSGPTRVAAAARASTGFVYLVRRRGVTGVGSADEPGDSIVSTRQLASGPMALGFGIATAGQAAEAARLGEGVIVGSALVGVAASAYAAGLAVPADMAGTWGRVHETSSDGRLEARLSAAEAVRRLTAELAAAVRVARRAGASGAAPMTLDIPRRTGADA